MKNCIERSVLDRLEGECVNIICNFTGFGKTTSTNLLPKKTVLLTNVKLQSGANICDHLWIRLDEIVNIKDFKKYLSRNTKVNLQATPYSYYKERRQKISKKKLSIGNIKIIAIREA